MKKTFVFITGGLGNQLFQLAATLCLGEKSEIVLDVINGNPRNGAHAKADLFSIYPPLEISIFSKKKNSLSTKIGGYVLRSGAEPTRIEKMKFYRIAVLFLASIYFTILHRKLISVKVNFGVGYSQVEPSSRFNTLLIGYFQSHNWADEPSVNKLLKSLDAQNTSKKFHTLRDELLEEKPIVIHVRRGDYAFEPNFGILESSYYKNGLSLLRGKGMAQKIWAFTDDRNWAEQLLNFDTLGIDDIQIVDDSDLSTGEVFDLMRYGSAYVIANSSFSWWAAYLSRIEACVVIAPEPWFAGLVEPKDLIPPSWLRIPGFESED